MLSDFAKQVILIYFPWISFLFHSYGPSPSHTLSLCSITSRVVYFNLLLKQLLSWFLLKQIITCKAYLSTQCCVTGISPHSPASAVRIPSGHLLLFPLPALKPLLFHLFLDNLFNWPKNKVKPKKVRVTCPRPQCLFGAMDRALIIGPVTKGELRSRWRRGHDTSVSLLKGGETCSYGKAK